MLLNKGLPTCWNELSICSLFKGGNRLDASNYRGLSIMNVFAKLYATIIASKLDTIAKE